MPTFLKKIQGKFLESSKKLREYFRKIIFWNFKIMKMSSGTVVPRPTQSRDPMRRAFADQKSIQTEYEGRIEQITVPNMVQLFTRDLDNGWEYHSNFCFPVMIYCWMIAKKLRNLWNQKWRPLWHSKPDPCWKSHVSLIFDQRCHVVQLFTRDLEN